MKQHHPFFRIQTRRGLGIFQLVYSLDLDAARRVHPRDRAAMRTTLDWFNASLPVPPGHAYECDRDLRAITWFKSSAPHMLDRMLAVARIARDYGHRTRVLRTRNPGTIVYEDDWQVVTHAAQDLRTLVMPVKRRPPLDRNAVRRERKTRAKGTFSVV